MWEPNLSDLCIWSSLEFNHSPVGSSVSKASNGSVKLSSLLHLVL